MKIIEENGSRIIALDSEGAQGDIYLERVTEIPETAVEEQAGGRLVLAHSETGHHHAIDAHGRDVVLFRAQRDPLVCYLRVDTDHADVVHHRSHDTHSTLRLGKGLWAITRQVEYTPEGMRMVKD